MSKTKNRIRELREKENLTLSGLSERLKEKGFSISSDAISKYERGDREPKLETWQKLADFFGVSVGYLQGLPLFDEYQNTLKDSVGKLKTYTDDAQKQKKEFNDLIEQYKLLDNKFSQNLGTNEDLEQQEKLLEKMKNNKKNIDDIHIKMVEALQQVTKYKDSLLKELDTIDTLVNNNNLDNK